METLPYQTISSGKVLSVKCDHTKIYRLLNLDTPNLYVQGKCKWWVTVGDWVCHVCIIQGSGHSASPFTEVQCRTIKLSPHLPTSFFFFPHAGQQQSGVLADLCLAWQQRRVLSCGSTESLMCWERWGERICRSDLEKPAGTGRSMQEGGWSNRARGVTLIFTCSTFNASPSPSTHLQLNSESACTYFFLKHAYHYHWSWVIAWRDMILHVWCGFENYSKAFIVNESRKAKTASDKCKFTVTNLNKKRALNLSKIGTKSSSWEQQCSHWYLSHHTSLSLHKHFKWL